ncbi:MAG: DNA-protecting protein DprA, partial [Planctomycetota bacterium]|nr:DNA-protecting protein DprA [Planctomycetota bacterium]
ASTRRLRGAPRGEPESLLWRLLDDSEALDAAELCRRTGLGAAEVAAALTALELDGYVQRLPGVGFLRR